MVKKGKQAICENCLVFADKALGVCPDQCRDL